MILAARQSRDEKRHVVGFRRRHAKADASGRPRGHVQEGDINVSSLLSLAKYECDGQADEGPVAGLVGIEVGVVSGVINLDSPGLEAPVRRPRHEECYQQA